MDHCEGRQKWNCMRGSTRSRDRVLNAMAIAPGRFLRAFKSSTPLAFIATASPSMRARRIDHSGRYAALVLGLGIIAASLLDAKPNKAPMAIETEITMKPLLRDGDVRLAIDSASGVWRRNANVEAKPYTPEGMDDSALMLA